MRTSVLTCLMVAACAAIFTSLPALADSTPPYGVVISSNATTDSDPPGTGEVDVLFAYPDFPGGPLNADYFEIATLEIQFAYPSEQDPLVWASSYIWNRTGLPLAGFEIALQGADFAGHDWSHVVQARADSPVVDLGTGTSPPLEPEEIALQHTAPDSEFSLLASGIQRTGDQGSGFTDATLTVLFDDPVQPLYGFALWYYVIPSPGAAGATQFHMSLTPIPVPEPTTLSLLALGLCLLPRPRRRA